MSNARRGVLVGAAIVLAGGLAAGITQVAGAEPQPSISQVQAQINADTAKFDKAVEQYDQTTQQLNAAKARLAQVNKEMAADQSKYDAAKVRVVEIADAQYMDSESTSLAGLITAKSPGQVLSDASMVAQITGARNQQTRAFLAAAEQLTSVQQEQQRTTFGISQLDKQRRQTKDNIQKQLDNEKATLASLTAQQQTAVQASNIGAGGTTSAKYTGPTSSQADKAVQFAYGALGCPYVFGATGPCGAGYDCSGLVQAAWASAGVSIPRDTYEQWAALPHISLSSIQPGDLLYYDGIGHVAMYVGGGEIIDAPSAGLDVEKIPMSTSWYASTFDGAARP